MRSSSNKRAARRGAYPRSSNVPYRLVVLGDQALWDTLRASSNSVRTRPSQLVLGAATGPDQAQVSSKPSWARLSATR